MGFQDIARKFLAGITDIVQSFRGTMLWITPGWYDFTLAYRRTLIGPLWETVAMAAWVGGLGVVFGSLLGRGDGGYFAYVSVGVILWFYMSSIVATSADLFTNKQFLILSINNPLYTYALRHIVVGLARLLLHAPVLVAVLVLVAPADSNPLLAVLGFAAVLLASLWVTPLLGLLGARFHDLRYALGLMMRFLFFITPVFWRADGLGDRSLLAHANPFTHFLEVVRAPLIGEPIWDASWTVVLVTNAVGLTVTLQIYGQHHRRLAFWI